LHFRQSEPACEVSHWDGLEDIDNPAQYPFYHVVPDPNDTIVAFGVKRQWRYVCEANLEACPFDRRNIDVDLEPLFQFNASAGVYIPPDDIVFRHGGQLTDNGITEQCMNEIKVSALNLVPVICLLKLSLSWCFTGLD
jgi:hypothetical protein